ncbi:MAG: GNAT family protein [Planctomycetota bacterium]
MLEPSVERTVPLLNRFQPGDRDALAELLNDPSIAEFTSVPHPYTREDADRWLRFVNQTTREHGETRQFAIRCDDELAGGFDFRRLQAQQKTEIGYWLGSPFRGLGIMTEVVEAACRYARKRWDLQRIEALVYPHNQASIRLLEKSGFSKEELLREHLRRDNDLVDALLFARTF